MSFWDASLPRMVFGQLDRTHVQGAASPYALSSDYRALGYNPALLTHAGWAGDFQKVSGGFEGGLSLKSNLLDRSAMWDQVLGRAGENSEPWTSDDWLDALTDEQLSFNVSFLIRGLCASRGELGHCLRQPQGGFCEHHVEFRDGQACSRTEDWICSSEIELVETGEVVSVDDYDFELGDLWEGVTIAGNATLANLLKETSTFFSSPFAPMKWASRGFGALNAVEGWSLHTGVGIRALLGSAYFDIHTQEDEVVAFGARSDGFKISNLQSLDSLLGGGPSADWLGLISPCGIRLGAGFWRCVVSCRWCMALCLFGGHRTHDVGRRIVQRQ